MPKIIYALCFVALVAAGCVDSSSPEATDESSLGSTAAPDNTTALDGEIEVQDCLGDCRNSRIADMKICATWPPEFQPQCRAEAWARYDQCVQRCL